MLLYLITYFLQKDDIKLHFTLSGTLMFTSRLLWKQQARLHFEYFVSFHFSIFCKNVNKPKGAKEFSYVKNIQYCTLSFRTSTWLMLQWTRNVSTSRKKPTYRIIALLIQGKIEGIGFASNSPKITGEGDGNPLSPQFRRP